MEATLTDAAIARLTELRDLLEFYVLTDRTDKFNMRVILHHSSLPRPEGDWGALKVQTLREHLPSGTVISPRECGTVGCFAGLLVLLAGDDVPEEQLAITAAAQLLDVPTDMTRATAFTRYNDYSYFTHGAWSRNGINASIEEAIEYLGKVIEQRTFKPK